MSNTRYLLMVLLIPLIGLPLTGILGVGAVELGVFVALAVAWVVAFIKHDRISPRVPLIALGAVLLLGVGVAVFNYATVDGSYVSVEEGPAD